MARAISFPLRYCPRTGLPGDQGQLVFRLVWLGNDPGQGSDRKPEWKTALWPKDGRFDVSSNRAVNDRLSEQGVDHGAGALSLAHRFKSGAAQRAEMFDVMQGANGMRAVFERRGWRYVHIESDWTGTRCGPSVANCVENGWVDDFVWEFARTSFLGPQMERSVTHPHVAQGLNTLATLESHARESDTGRDFVFAHILLPHPPLQLRPNCDIAIEQLLLGQHYRLLDTNPETLVLRENGYRDQAACLNERLFSIIESLPEEASVVITSDHGPDLRGQLDKRFDAWDAIDIEQRFRIFHAARLPQECEPGEEHDLVNLVRSEVACVTGASLPPLEPYFEISPYFYSGDQPRVLTEEDLSVWLDDH